MGKSHSVKSKHRTASHGGKGREVPCREATRKQHASTVISLVPKLARRHFDPRSNVCTIDCKHACKPG